MAKDKLPKNVYGARVTSVKPFAKSVSIMCKVVSANGDPIKPLTVDIRVPHEVAKDYQKMGLAQHAQLTFNAEGIAAHQPTKPGGQQGDRFLPEKKDRAGQPIPGTKTPVHRILSLDSSSIIIQLGASQAVLEPETDEATIAQNRNLCEVVATIAQAAVPDAVGSEQAVAEELEEAAVG